MLPKCQTDGWQQNTIHSANIKCVCIRQTDCYCRTAFHNFGQLRPNSIFDDKAILFNFNFGYLGEFFDLNRWKSMLINFRPNKKEKTQKMMLEKAAAATTEEQMGNVCRIENANQMWNKQSTFVCEWRSEWTVNKCRKCHIFYIV